jgi:AcrR family transcriptional regulator
MTGLRERKKQQTRHRISAVAMRLFAERGYESVTVAEIADTADVAKVTLFKYFPSKEALALDGVGEQNLAALVIERPAKSSPLAALRDGVRQRAVPPADAAESRRLLTQLRVIMASPALQEAADRQFQRQRFALADALAADFDELTAILLAAQLTASLRAVQERYFAGLAQGTSPEVMGQRLTAEVDRAFALIMDGVRW